MEDLKLKYSLGNNVNKPFFMGDVFDRDGSVCYCNNTATVASGGSDIRSRLSTLKFGGIFELC